MGARDDGEETLLVIQEDTDEPAAEKHSLVAEKEDAPETEILQTLTLTNSTTASTLPRRDRRPPCGIDDFVVGEELENLALHSDASSLPGVPETAEEALGDRNWRRAMQREYDSLMTN